MGAPGSARLCFCDYSGSPIGVEQSRNLRVAFSSRKRRTARPPKLHVNWRTAVTWDGTPLRFHASEPVTILSQGFHLPVFRALLVAVFALAAAAHAATRVRAAPVPPEMRSGFFTVTVNGQRVDVAHAASNYEFVNFDTTGPVEISITAAEPGFWDGGVDIEPWRLGLRASREGPTIRFRLPGPAKISISRPGDFLNDAKMLFLFAGLPPAPPRSAWRARLANGLARRWVCGCVSAPKSPPAPGSRS